MHRSKKLVSVVVLAASVVGALFAGVNHTAFARGLTAITSQDWYIPSGTDPWGTAFDSSGHVWVAVPGCDPEPTCPANTPPGKIEEFDPSTFSWIATIQLPANFAQPLFLAFDAAGRIWFAQPNNNSIGMYNPATKVFQQWAVPTPGAGPWDVVVDHKGFVWFTEHYTNKIGRFTPGNHVFKEFTTPSANSQPYGLVVDANNNIWFTENNSAVARIGKFTTGGVMHEYLIRDNPPSGLTPHMITLDSTTGNIWWSEGFVGMIGELKVAQAKPGTTNGVTEYAYPANCTTCGGTHTSGISVDSHGTVWFDDSLQSIFGSFPDTGTGSFTEYATPTPNAHPHDGLRVDSQDRIWFDEEFRNKLAEAQ
jgi:streptogramin lyase